MINPIYAFGLLDQTQNLFNHYTSDNQPGYAVNSVNGTTYPLAGWNATGYMKLNQAFAVAVSYIADGAFYDKDKKHISGFGDLAGGARNIICPANAVYMRISVRNADWSYNGFTAYLIRKMRPVYKDDLAKEYELETNQRFYRAKLSGKIAFVRDDYDFIRSKPFGTKFILLIFQSDDYGQSWFQYYQGKFMNTDCEFDDDDKRVQMQPDVLDEYNDVLAGLEKEYNLIELAPAINPIHLTKRPLIQLYIPGDSVVSCFLGGIYWEQDANATTDRNALINTYYFSLCNLLKEINVTGSTNPNVNALYVGAMSMGNNNTFTGSLYPNVSNGYYIYASQQYQPPFWGAVTIEIRRSSDNVAMYRYTQVLPGNAPWDNAVFDAAAVSGSGATGSAHCEMATYSVYARYLLDVETIQGIGTYPLPADDIVDYNRNYRRAIGYAIDVARISNNSTTTPTQWGRRDDGTYFAPPYSIWGQQFYPIARSTWRYASIWFAFSMFDEYLEEDGRKQYTLRDAYPLASCISVLLKQFAPGITHEATPEYSQFLYSDTNPISGQIFRLFISQKSNVKVGDYDRPAQKAPVTLQQLTNMLRDCYRAFWYIEDGKFKIEHIQWFRNGGSYSYNPIIGVDLTQLTNVRNSKKWGFDTSKWSFDKVDMPERFQFKWMDDCTKGFEGYPIEVISEYVTAGKIEEVNISNFTADVDYIILNPTAISDDGFVLMAANEANLLRFEYGDTNYTEGGVGVLPGRFKLNGGNGYTANVRFTVRGDVAGLGQLIFFNNSGELIAYTTIFNYTTTNQLLTVSTLIPDGAKKIGFYNGVSTTMYVTITRVFVPGLFELPIVQENVDGITYIMQNGYLSMLTLQPNYYVYDLPASDVKINNSTAYVQGIERKKKQVLTFPVYDDPNPMQLVKTPMGNGQIDKLSITLHSRSIKATLKYDTEQ